MQKQLFTKTRWLVTIILLATLSIGQMWGAVTALTIPKSWAASDGKSAYTDALGCTKSGLGSDYSASGTKLKFDNTGDYMIIQLASSPAYVSYAILGNSFSGGTFKVQESSNGSTYTDVATYTSSPSGTKTNNLKAATRYIKFVYTTKSSGNIGLGTIVIKARTTVTLNKNGGSADGSAVIAYNATAKESLSAPTYDASHEIEGYYAEAGCSTKVLNSDGSFAASSVSGWITSSKWSKDAATATLYAKWNSTGTSVSLTKGASSNGSFTLSPVSSVTTTSSAQNVTVSCNPNTGYYVSNVTATNPATGTATVTGSGNSWNVQYSSGANGTSTISVTFSPIWYLKGDFNSWDASIPLTNITSNVATVDLSFSKTTAYEFKVYNAQMDAWYGNNGKIIDDVSGWTFSTSENNCTVFATVADDYTFNFNISNQQMQVVYPDMTHPNDAYVYLTNWWDCYVHWWGTSGDLTSWGSDLQLNRHEEICETDYWCVPILDGYPSLIMKDNAGDASNSTGDQTTNSNAGKYITHNGVSWGWHDFATYTISYASGGGSGSMSSHTDLCPGSNQTLAANTFTKSDYTFTGWVANVNVKIGGSTVTAGTLISNAATIQDIQSNITLTAQWTHVPVITLSTSTYNFGDRKVNGGPYTMTFTVTGQYLTENIALTLGNNAAGHFSIDKTSITQTAGSVSATTITVSYSPTTAGSHGGPYINVTSTGATTKSVTLYGTGKWEVIWSVNGETTTSLVANSTKPTFPSPSPSSCDLTSTTFIGWSTAAWDGKLDDVSAKTIHTSNSTMSNITSNGTTFYAVFAKATAGAAVESWEQCTTLDDFIDGDFYLFVSPQYNSTYYYVPAVSAVAAQETFSSAADGNHVASNSTPTSITKAQGAWKLIKSSTSWKIQSSNASTIYLYTGDNNNKLGANTSGTATGTWTITKHASTSTFAFQYSGTSRYLCAYNASPYGFRTYTGTGTNGTGYLTVYHRVSNTPITYSEYLTTCCTDIVALSTGAETHCDVSVETTSLATCTETASERQVTITVDPDDGYSVPTNLTWTRTDGTVATPTKNSGPTDNGDGTFSYVYQFAQNQTGTGTFGAVCTANTYTINLNDQSATTAATPSSITVTFDASTNLTGTVVTSLPTRTGFDFGGYYTATGGGGVQIIATDGTVNASAGGGSTYTDASKNWKYADDLTIYAKWTEKALENYRTACMTFEVTNQAGTDDPDIHLTSYKGITVYATSAAGNLIRIQGKALEAAGVLGAGTNNKQNIRIKYFDMKSGSPVEVAKAQSPFHLCNDGTSNYNQADGSNININGLSSYDQTYSISYEPKEYGQTDHYQMEVRLQNNTTEAITVMVDLYGRSLPKEFVIATHSGASWYALPNDLAETQGAQNLITPVAITVDNTSTPTKVTSVHDNVLYKGADRYTSANKNGLRFSNDGSHYLQVSTVLDVNKMWLSGSGGTDVQDWHLKSADFGAYEVYMDPIGTSTASDGRRIELYDSYIGYHGALTGTGNVYFLPMEYPEMGSSIMEWGTDHVVIFLATPGTATKVKVQVGGNAVGDAQTLSDIKKDEGVYRVTASLTTDDAGAEIKLYFYTDGDVLVGSDKFTIPKLISAHDATTSGISKALAAECDLVILNGGILTVSESTSGTQLAFRDLYIYGGGKLVVPSGKYISFDKVIMRGGHLNAAWQYQYSHPQLVLNGTMTNAEGKIYYDYLTNNAQFYSLSLPYNVTLTDIVNPDFNNKRSWQIHGYDGAKRASGSQVEGWYDVEEGSTPGSIAALSSSDHLTAGVGYTFWGAMQKVNGVRQRWSVNRFKMTLASGSAEAEKSGVTVTAHGMTAGELNDDVAPNDAGWNMLGNPYLADIGGTEGFETAVKGTIISWHNVKDEDENGNWTGTWHQESNETNVRYVRIPNNQGTEYEQTRFKDATLRAFHHFFIQVGDGGTFSFNISMRAQSAPSRFRKGASLPEEMDLDLRLTDGDNTSQFGLTLNNEFSAGYNGGDEDMTEDLSGTYVKAYTLVGETRLTFNGLPYTAAEQLIPVGYRAQGNGYHTFSYKADADAHYIAHIWLTDKEESTVTDLKENTYKFYTDAGVNDERFTLNVVFTENTATGMDDGINDENGKPMKFIYRDQLYILRGGVIYDATGKRVREVNK